MTQGPEKPTDKLLTDWLQAAGVPAESCAPVAALFASVVARLQPGSVALVRSHKDLSRLSHFRGRDLWRHRLDRNQDPLKFVETVYPDRREGPLCLADIEKLDKGLWVRLMHSPIPDSFGLPTEHDAYAQADVPFKSSDPYVKRIVEGVVATRQRLNRRWAHRR
jgi:hypothetical protein